MIRCRHIATIAGIIFVCIQVFILTRQIGSNVVTRAPPQTSVSSVLNETSSLQKEQRKGALHQHVSAIGVQKAHHRGRVASVESFHIPHQEPTIVQNASSSRPSPQLPRTASHFQIYRSIPLGRFPPQSIVSRAPHSQTSSGTEAAQSSSMLHQSQTDASSDMLITKLGSRLPFFLHLHKAGGTTLCHNARVVNQLNAPIRNCNAPGDGPRTLRDGIDGFANGNLTCEERQAYMNLHCIQFFATERWLDDELCVDRFMYLTVLRDPIKRIESNCRFEKVKPETALEWLQNSYFPEERVYLGTAAVDNFYVRSFAGREVFHRPAGGVTREDLEVAKRRLKRFEVVLILEHMAKGFLQMEKILGWEMPTERDSHRSFGSGDVTIRFSEAERRVLQQSNMLDAEFYDFAVALSAKRVASIQRLSQNRLPKLTPPSRVGLSPGGKIRTRAQCSRAFSDWKVRQEQRRHQDQRFLQRRRQRIQV